MDSTFGAAISGLFGTILALAVVLGLAYVCLRFLRKWQDRGLVRDPNEPERTLRFVRALPLGQRERLVLVEAEGELLLVGVSGGAISLIRNYGAKAAGDGSAVPSWDQTPSDAHDAGPGRP